MFEADIHTGVLWNNCVRALAIKLFHDTFECGVSQKEEDAHWYVKLSSCASGSAQTKTAREMEGEVKAFTDLVMRWELKSKKGASCNTEGCIHVLYL